MTSQNINKEEIKNQILNFLRQQPTGSDTFTVFLAIKNAEISYEAAKALCKELEDEGYIATSESDHSMRDKVLSYPVSITVKGQLMDESGGFKMVVKEKKKGISLFGKRNK